MRGRSAAAIALFLFTISGLRRNIFAKQIRRSSSVATNGCLIKTTKDLTGIVEFRDVQHFHPQRSLQNTSQFHLFWARIASRQRFLRGEARGPINKPAFRLLGKQPVKACQNPWSKGSATSCPTMPTGCGPPPAVPPATALALCSPLAASYPTAISSLDTGA